MGTPLYLGAMRLFDLYGNTPCMPFAYYMDYKSSKLVQVKHQTSKWKRINYFLSAVFVFLICSLTTGLLLLKHKYEPGSIKSLVVLIWVLTYLSEVISVTTATSAILFSEDVVCCTNQLLGCQLEDINRPNKNIEEKSNYISLPTITFVLRHFKLYNFEVNKLLRTFNFQEVDVAGLLNTANILKAYLMTTVIPLFALYTHWEPIHIILKCMSINVLQNFPTVLFVIRSKVMFVCTYGVIRNLAYHSNWLLWYLFAILESIRKIKKQWVSKTLIAEYIKLVIMLQHSNCYISLWSGVILSIMFVNIICYICFACFGWKIVKLTWYIPEAQTGILLIFMWTKGINICVQINEDSTNLLKHTWPQQVCQLHKREKINSLVASKRMIRAQKSLEISCLGTVWLSHESRLNSFENLVSYTVDFMLLFQKEIDTLSNKAFL